MILRSIYRILLRLRPKEWRGEMLAVFDQARLDARAQGWLAYAGFGAREVAGLLHAGREPGGRWRWPLSGTLAGLLAGWAVTLAMPEMYTSRALFRALPSSIPERFASGTTPITFETVRHTIFPSIFSRNTATNIIRTYDLYRPERSRMPMEDVVEIMFRSIDIRQSDTSAIRVAFSYPDALLAQKVTRDLMTRLIDESTRERQVQSMMTVSFLRDRANHAATEWDELNAQVRKAAGPGVERLQLDSDIARRRYETLRQQVIEAEMIASLEERRQGPTLEVLDLPSLPESPAVSHWTILAGGGLGGLVIGIVAGWLRRLRLATASTPALIGA